ncbi:MAG TPA: L,D-transpeptidase family protein [Acidimicrobiia bacterium]
MWGGEGNDVLTGTDGPDVIVGRGGDDHIRGWGGDDVICGGGGADEIHGGAGDDLIAAGPGPDLVDGGPGDDEISGKGGFDVLAGGPGHDFVGGGRGVDAGTGGDGVDECHTESASGCEVRALEPGDSGPAVAALQRLLKEKTFYGGAIDGIYGEATSSAVVAFHKVLERNRIERFRYADWSRLLGFDPLPPVERTEEPDRIEIDITHQVLYLIEDDAVAAIVPISSGGGYLYYSPYQRAWIRAETPRGDFQLRWVDYGWGCDPLTGWCVYNYWSFHTYYGVHGYDPVPTYPASHGCVRLTLWDSDRLTPRFRLGMPVHIWD